jgi:hypothetical protein
LGLGVLGILLLPLSVLLLTVGVSVSMSVSMSGSMHPLHRHPSPDAGRIVLCPGRVLTLIRKSTALMSRLTALIGTDSSVTALVRKPTATD